MLPLPGPPGTGDANVAAAGGFNAALHSNAVIAAAGGAAAAGCVDGDVSIIS